MDRRSQDADKTETGDLIEARHSAAGRLAKWSAGARRGAANCDCSRSGPVILR
jgi:hypothetical protein